MIYNIDISQLAGRSYPQFSVELSGRLIRFELRWLEQYQFFAVDLYEGNTALTQGRGLHPEQNLVEGLLTGLGSIYLTGDQPTIGNLGISNRLRYDDGE